jgi:hypothetical protein
MHARHFVFHSINEKLSTATHRINRLNRNLDDVSELFREHGGQMIRLRRLMLLFALGMKIFNINTGGIKNSFCSIPSARCVSSEDSISNSFV